MNTNTGIPVPWSRLHHRMTLAWSHAAQGGNVTVTHNRSGKQLDGRIVAGGEASDGSGEACHGDARVCF